MDGWRHLNTLQLTPIEAWSLKILLPDGHYLLSGKLSCCNLCGMSKCTSSLEGVHICGLKLCSGPLYRHLEGQSFICKCGFKKGSASFGVFVAHMTNYHAWLGEDIEQEFGIQPRQLYYHLKKCEERLQSQGKSLGRELGNIAKQLAPNDLNLN